MNILNHHCNVQVRSLGERRETLRTTGIVEPNKHDILCGKDKECLSHYGSQRFHAVIEAHCNEYQQATTKQEKMGITRKIVVTLNRLSCRFLKYNEELQNWHEISHVAARDKVSHALRFANRKNNCVVKRETQKCSSRPEKCESTSTFDELQKFGTLSDYEPLPILGVEEYEPISLCPSKFSKQARDDLIYEPKPILEGVKEPEPMPFGIDEPKLNDLSWIINEPLMKEYLLNLDFDSNVFALQ